MTAGADSTELISLCVGSFRRITISVFGDLCCPALYEGNDGEDKLPKGTYSAVTSFFAPTRYIDYTDESQLEDAENAPFAQETEWDKTALANFVRCVEDHGGLQLDATKLRFRWIRDYHPHYSISVCPLYALPFTTYSFMCNRPVHGLHHVDALTRQSLLFSRDMTCHTRHSLTW